MLAALALEAGARPVNLGIARDTREELSRLVAKGLAADALVLSGGVSAGVLDLAPAVLAELGVRQVFHKVQLKPGKPLWFGIVERESQSTLVFGLPGNPVSSFVCFELFVLPALRRQAGQAEAAPVSVAARLAAPFSQRGDRPTYHPALLRRDGSPPQVELVRWRGSADLRALARANALAYFPQGVKEFPAGEEVRVIEV